MDKGSTKITTLKDLEKNGLSKFFLKDKFPNLSNDKKKMLILGAYFYLDQMVEMGAEIGLEEIEETVNRVEEKMLLAIYNVFLAANKVLKDKNAEVSGRVVRNVLRTIRKQNDDVNTSATKEYQLLTAAIGKIVSVSNVFKTTLNIEESVQNAFSGCFTRVENFWKMVEVENLDGLLNKLTKGLKDDSNFSDEEIAALASKCGTLFFNSSAEKIDKLVEVIKSYKNYIIEIIRTDESLTEDDKNSKLQNVVGVKFKDILKKCATLGDSPDLVAFNALLFEGVSINGASKNYQLIGAKYQNLIEDYGNFKMKFEINDIMYSYLSNLTMFKTNPETVLKTLAGLNDQINEVFKSEETFEKDLTLITPQNYKHVSRVGNTLLGKHGSGVIAILSTLMSNEDGSPSIENVKNYLKHDLSIFTTSPRKLANKILESINGSSLIEDSLRELFEKGFEEEPVSTTNSEGKSGGSDIPKSTMPSFKNKKEIKLNFNVSQDELLNLIVAFGAGEKIEAIHHTTEKIEDENVDAEFEKEFNLLLQEEEVKLNNDWQVEIQDEYKAEIFESLNYLRKNAEKVIGSCESCEALLSEYSDDEMFAEAAKMFLEFKKVEFASRWAEYEDSLAKILEIKDHKFSKVIDEAKIIKEKVNASFDSMNRVYNKKMKNMENFITTTRKEINDLENQILREERNVRNSKKKLGDVTDPFQLRRDLETEIKTMESELSGMEFKCSDKIAEDIASVQSEIKEQKAIMKLEMEVDEDYLAKLKKNIFYAKKIKALIAKKSLFEKGVYLSLLDGYKDQVLEELESEFAEYTLKSTERKEEFDRILTMLYDALEFYVKEQGAEEALFKEKKNAKQAAILDKQSDLTSVIGDIAKLLQREKTEENITILKEGAQSKEEQLLEKQQIYNAIKEKEKE